MASPAPPSSTTTFVQADANTFRHLVQKLTGFTDNSDKNDIAIPLSFPSKALAPNLTGPRRTPFKLHERRRSMRKLHLNSGLEPNSQPSPSPVTPLLTNSVFYLSSPAVSPPSMAVSDEGQAVAGKGFNQNQSPLCTPRMSEQPELLILFPLSSPNQRTHE